MKSELLKKMFFLYNLNFLLVRHVIFRELPNKLHLKEHINIFDTLKIKIMRCLNVILLAKEKK